MNIDEIEGDLSNHPTDPDAIISEILNVVIQNQVLLHSLIEVVFQQMHPNDSQEDYANRIKGLRENIDAKLADLQARISLRITKE